MDANLTADVEERSYCITPIRTHQIPVKKTNSETVGSGTDIPQTVDGVEKGGRNRWS